MSNPNSPPSAVSADTSTIADAENVSEVQEGIEGSELLTVQQSEVDKEVVPGEGGSNENSQINLPTGSAAIPKSSTIVENFPILRLNSLSSSSDKQLEMGKKKNTGLVGKSQKRSESVDSEGKEKQEGNVDADEGQSSQISQSSAFSEASGLSSSPTVAGPLTPAIVKPRRPSVHFSVEGSQVKLSKIPERTRQDSGGSNGGSRKHRSRKEKLICRSECPTDMAMDTNNSSPLPGTSVRSPATFRTPKQSISPVSSPSLMAQSPEVTAPLTQSDLKNSSTITISVPPVPLPIHRDYKSETSAKRGKTNVKRIGSGVPRGRKANSHSILSSSFKEPTLKRKKVIEIVSPKKRERVGHFDIVKSSSDPISIRAAAKNTNPFKLKNKPIVSRYKFSRANLHKSSSGSRGFRQGFESHQQRIRRPSAATAQAPGRVFNKRVGGSPLKKEQEVESPSFPPSFVDDLLWLLQDAESEFGPSRSTKQVPTQTSVSASTSQSTETIQVPPNNLLAPSTSVTSRLAFGRRRVESEPPGATGFEMAPGSPTGSQSLYHIRKDLYFSPSPSYATATAGPTGRRRYSRRRHAKIHPPFEDSNCGFQDHYCPNPRVIRSQYCEKHLHKGPASSYTICRFTKDGRRCCNLVPSYDTMSFCEKHANKIAKAEYDLRNPNVQPNQAKNIIASLSKIFKEGLIKPDSGHFAAASPIPDIFQIINEPEIVQELPLGDYTGGLVEELDAEGERNVNPDRPDYEALKNAGYFTTEEIIQIHINKLRKLKALYSREKELEWLIRQQKLRFFKEGLEKLKQFGPRFTTNPYLINTKLNLPTDYVDHQIKQYDAAKAILQTAYKADGQKGLLRLKMLQKTQDLAQKSKASGQKQHDSADAYDSDTDAESDNGEARDKFESTRYSGLKSYKCAYNEGYAVRACQNLPVYWSTFCLTHILSDTKQVQWVPCKRSIGPDSQDACKTPCFRVLEKHGCPLHSPLVITKHKPLRMSEEELNLEDSDNEEEELTLENESNVLANLVTDECLSLGHLEEILQRLSKRGPLEITDTSDSEETDEEGLAIGSLLPSNDDDDEDMDVETQISGLAQ